MQFKNGSGKKISIHPNIIVLHDFVLDHYVVFDRSLNELITEIKHVAYRGGGNIVVKQYLSRGGKASNLSSALARLGAHVHLIGRTSKFGYELANILLKPMGIDISGVRADGDLALTVSLEMPHINRVINIMFSYPGSNSNFGFSDLIEDELELIKKADGVALTDWALNSKGTDLAKGIFSCVNHKKILLLDPGDVSRRSNSVRGLIEKVLRRGYGILSLNESEAICLAENLTHKKIPRKTLQLGIASIRAGKILASELGMRVDLHTQFYSASFKDNYFVRSPSYLVKVRRVTGAGDAWNAGNIYGECIGLSDQRRLEFANAVAAYYISAPIAQHPTKEIVEKFIHKQKIHRIKLES